MFNIIALLLLYTASFLTYGACTQTVSVGVNLVTTITNAASGSTICLNNGNYGTISLSGISKSSDTIITSVNAKGATLGVNTIDSSSHLTFDNLTVPIFYFGNSEANTYIKFTNNTATGQIYFYGNGGTQHNLIDNNTFDNVGTGPKGEGRLQIYGGGDLIISHNHFADGCSDGIQIGGTGTVIGPGNIFERIKQSSCTSGEHADSIQQYGEVVNQTITQNYFIDDTVCIGTYNSSDGVVVSNNVFIQTDSNDKRCVIDFGSSTNLDINHNTISQTFTRSMRVGKINLTTASTGQIRNNIFDGDNYEVAGTSGYTGTTSYNLFSVGVTTIGTNVITGNPIYTGGTSLTKLWSGWQLSGGSPGKSNASDGQDRGTLYYGGASGGLAPTISALVCSPTIFQSIGTTTCTVTASESPTSYAYSFNACSAAQCSTASTSGSATVSCIYGGPCTPCATATNASGTSPSYCAVNDYLKIKYRKPSNLQRQ